ncbi:MAG: hypothetical protein C0459_11415 [Chitinophaga sp.]|nr:hypothetical protein [Chitinophaga sp.]
MLKDFDDEYKSINKLLPVYKVAFERNDDIRIYVETIQDRFAFAVDDKRAVFNKIFALFHTWEWLNFLGKGRVFVELFFVGFAFLTATMGIYIFFITKTKKANGNGLVKARRNHRLTSIIVVLFTLLFTFSGFYHATTKLKDEHYNVSAPKHYHTASINFNFNNIASAVHQAISNIQLATIDTTTYWQVYIKAKQPLNKQEKKTKDLMKEMNVQAPVVVYINTSSNNILSNGEKLYAHYLATQFTNHTAKAIVSDSVVTKFAGEYGFINKRLPVWRVNFNDNNNQRVYVETSTGNLAADINDIDVREALSFNFFHKHHFMDFAGKEWRDFSTMFWAAAQIAMVIVGLILYFKYRNKTLLPNKK